MSDAGLLRLFAQAADLSAERRTAFLDQLRARDRDAAEELEPLLSDPSGSIPDLPDSDEAREGGTAVVDELALDYGVREELGRGA